MRVTNKQMTDFIINNLSKQNEALQRLQIIVSSGKRINKPSDDPIGMAKVLDYRKTISSVDQYRRNIVQGKTWLNVTETALGEIQALLNQAKNIAVDQSSGELDTRSEAAEEVKHIYDQVLQLANTKSGNSYLFAGHDTQTAPFSRDSSYNATYSGDSGDIQIIVGENVKVTINADGNESFTGSGLTNGVSIFDTLRDLIIGLENSDTQAGTTQISNQIASLQDGADQIQNARAGRAAAFTRLDTTDNQLAKFKLNVENMLSGTEGADIEKAIVELNAQQTAYQTSLATAARILQPSLIQFLG